MCTLKLSGDAETPFIIEQEEVKFSQMVFSLMLGVAAQEMHLQIATIRKIMFKRSEHRPEQISYSL